MRTIANLWRYEHQSDKRSANRRPRQQAVRQDASVVDDMSAIGQSLDKAQDNYRQAMKKLSSGRGNVLRRQKAFSRFRGRN
ncbi:DNA recombination protein RmuC [Escherichia albertii]|uniref:DNA recombination protein RmuC n=1 Tax=Escherichia albertii TaxID=208962 RepID=UPI00351D3ED4